MRPRIKILLTSTFTIFILLGFTVPLNQVGNWYQQFMPNINGASIRDITFTDSLNGFAVTSIGGSNSYILKTTNSGDNWTIKFLHNQPFVRVEFINANTGFTNAFQTIFKTINAGENWTPINLPGIFGDDMFVLNESTIWLAMSESLTGGVYKTTNGGTSWTQQLALGSMNPEKIYMYNGDTGYVTKINAGTPYIRRTTDGGQTWNLFVNGKGFSDMFFVNSLTGWTAYDSVRKTTNGGLNWQTQVLPYGMHDGGFLNYSYIFKFSYLNTDTIWGVGGRIAFPNTQLRGLIYKTTNGGANWSFHLPDTSINNAQYLFVQFLNKNTGWAYGGPRGVHTTNGGDTTFLGVKQISYKIPKVFKLFQNYPNPFNPKTIISYQLTVNSIVIIKVFDITGREVITLVNEKQNTGTYEVGFSGIGLSSGVYFYSLIIDGIIIDTKKMVLVK